MKPRIAFQRTVREQLTFELEGSLFGRDENQRRAFRIIEQGLADFRQAAERLAAAGRTGKKTDLHTGVLTDEDRKSMTAAMTTAAGVAATTGFAGCTRARASRGKGGELLRQLLRAALRAFRALPITL